MKKSYYIMISLLLLVVFSCSKDSNDEPEEVVSAPVDRAASFQSIGDSANDFLSNDSFDELKIQIGHVRGFRPAVSAINDLVEFLKERTFKETVEIEYLELDSPDQETLTLQEIVNLERDHRTAFNTGKTLAIYIYFSDAPSDNDDPESNLVTLGAVYRNTSMVIYESSIRNLANRSRVLSVATVETATLIHEFGHLFGLVNIGTPMVNPHEGTTTNDEGEEVGNRHCNQPNCLMLAELEFGAAMGKMLTARNGQVPTLDPECLRDLRANGGR